MAMQKNTVCEVCGTGCKHGRTLCGPCTKNLTKHGGLQGGPPIPKSEELMAELQRLAALNLPLQRRMP